MYTKILVIFFCPLFFIYSQANKKISINEPLSIETKMSIVRVLSAPDSIGFSDTDILSNLELISWFKITEAIPEIENNFWRYNTTIQEIFLQILSELNAATLHQYALAYWDTVSNKTDLPEIKKFNMLLSANEFITQFNDFSKTEILLQLISNNSELINIGLLRAIVTQLNRIMLNSSEYEPVVKPLIESIALNAEDSFSRACAMRGLEEKYGIDEYAIMEEMFYNDSEYSNRFLIVQFAYKYPHSQLKQLLKDELYYAEELSGPICHFLISNYSCPFDFNYLKEYALAASDQSVVDFINVSLKVHSILSPDSLSEIEMLDSLLSYIPQCSSLSWVDTSLANTLATLADSAKSYLVSGDSVSCAKQLLKLKQKADYEFADSLNVTGSFVTENGRIFINAYTQHILGRLPAVPVELNFNIKIPNNSGTIGEAVKEPLPANLSFRAAYAGMLKDKVQNTAETIHLNSSSHN